MPFILTEIYHLLLQGMYAYHLVLAEQLNACYYAPGNIKHVKERLKTLVDHKYLDYLQLLTTKGSGAYVYFLAAKGRRYLHEAGYDLTHYYRPSKEKERSHFHLMHTLELNDFLVAAAAFVRTHHGYMLEMRHDLDLKRTPIHVPIKRRVNDTWLEETKALVPDAWLTFQLPDNTRRWMWVEHDRGEASAKKIKHHVRGILAFITTEGYKQTFGASGMTVVYTTSAGVHHREKLQAWVREVLLEHAQKTQQGAMGTAFSHQAQQANRAVSYRTWFLFTTTPPLRSAALDPDTLFTHPVWYYPFGNKPTSLFRLS